MATRDMTRGERARFNGLQASMPMSRRYILVIDNEKVGMNIVTKSDRPENLLSANRNHPLQEGEQLLLIDKSLMQICVEDRKPRVEYVPLPPPYCSEE